MQGPPFWCWLGGGWRRDAVSAPRVAPGDLARQDTGGYERASDDGDFGTCFLRGPSRRIASHYEDIHVQANQLGSEAGEPVGPSLGIPELDGEVLALDVAR